MSALPQSKLPLMKLFSEIHTIPWYSCSTLSISATAEFEVQIPTGFQQCMAHIIFKYTNKNNVLTPEPKWNLFFMTVFRYTGL